MKSISGKHLCRILERAGWQLKKVHGSHYVYMKDGRIERISIPVHANKDLKRGMLTAIMKIVGLEKSDL